MCPSVLLPLVLLKGCVPQHSISLLLTQTFIKLANQFGTVADWSHGDGVEIRTGSHTPLTSANRSRVFLIQFIGVVMT